MKRNVPHSLLTTAVVLAVFLWSAMITLPVLADGDETPPPPTATPTDVTPPPTETATPVPTEEIIPSTAVAPVATDTPVAEPTEVVPTDTPVTDPSASTEEVPTSSDSNVLLQVPNDTQVVVTDGDGNALPLASADAAEAIETSDPIWCPAGVAVPVGGGAGCSPAMTSLTDLIAWLTVHNPGVAGTIWIEKTYNSSTAVGDAGATGFTLDGLTLTNMANVALTVKGGWNGLGTGTVDINTPSTFDGDSFSVINWKANVTLNDLLIKNVPGAGSTALTVKTTKKVTVNRVKVKDNAGSGAKIDNTASGTGTGDVQITLSQFLNNAGGHGLEVDSRGAITLSSVLADGNSGSGANLDNSMAPVAKNVTINTGNNEFNNNTYYGLYIYSKGAVILKDITGNGNGYHGAYVNNLEGVAQPVTLTGINIFSENKYYGLVVYSTGAISVSNLVAYDNIYYGAYLSNSSATTAQPVSVTGKNEFKYNGGGLWIQSQGAITISNLTVVTDPILKPGNGTGVYLNNNYNFASNVTLTGTNVFTGNYGSGLEVYSKGIITLYTVTSTNNGIGGSNGYGASLNNGAATSPKAVNLYGTNSFSNNYSGGLKITSKGAIILSNVTANVNPNGIGAQLDNLASTSALPQNVTISGINSFSGNSQGGLVVSTYGAITLSNMTASNNTGGYGANLTNKDGTTPKAVILSGYGHFDGNLSGGLSILTKGAITLYNVTANANTNGIGAFLDNQTSGSSALPQNVTISGTNSFSGNSTDGLVVLTYGTITLNTVTATNNTGGFGASLKNCMEKKVWENSQYKWVCISSSIPQAVTLLGTNHFDGNLSGGLTILTKGAITITNTTADNNRNNLLPYPSTPTAGGFGVNLDNRTYGNPDLPQNVTILGTNSFNGNYLYGLQVSTYGTVLVNNLTANGNNYSTVNGYGTLIQNETASIPRPVTVTGYGNFNNNKTFGLRILTGGAITLTKVTANTNAGGTGAELDNQQIFIGLLPQNVTINGTNSFSGNSQGGLVIRTYGSITLSNVTANNNAGGYGADLRNCLLDDSNEDPSLWTCVGSYTPKAVILSGSNSFNENISGGLRILAIGAITLNNTTANTNKVDANNAGGFGAELNNTYGSGSPQNVTITGYGHFDQNGLGGGIKIITKGTITLSNITADGNTAQYGAELDNTFGNPLLARGVIIYGTNSVSKNAGYGLKISTYGAILINNLTANENHVIGATLNNKDSAAPQPVILSGYGKFNAGSMGANYGLKVLSKGAITLTNIEAKNSYTGVSLSNVNDLSPQPVTLNGTNLMSSNDIGLEIISSGVVKANNLSVSGNSSDGVRIQNNTLGAGVFLTGMNSFIGSQNGVGLDISSLGPIYISNLYAAGNYYNNVVLDNSGGIGGVTLSGTNRIGFGKGGGLRIDTKGAVLLNNLDVADNYGYGVLINNTFSGMATPQNVTLTGYINTANNGRFGQAGLKITTYGTITINNIYASCNGFMGGCRDGAGGYGVWLDNCGYNGTTCTSTGAPRGVTITGYANLEKNGKDGLWITSLGAITISNLDAEGNGGNGAYLNNQWTNAVGGITLIGVNTFECNGYACADVYEYMRNYNSSGLVAYSNGAITLSNVSATSNINNGVYLDNRGSTGKAVTFTGVNIFLNNGNTKGTTPVGSGLVILSESQITLNNVTASENKVNGINLDNRTVLPTNPGIKLAGLNTFNKNGAKGIYLYTNGIIDLSNIIAEFNGSDGLNATTTRSLTLSCGKLNNNGGYGYYLTADGLLTLKEVYAFGDTFGNDWNSNLTPVIKRSCYVPPPPVVVRPERKRVPVPNWDEIFPDRQ